MRGETELKYGVLEATQDYSGVPTGVLLCSTHVVSLLRDGRKQEAREFVTGLQAMAETIDGLVQKVSTSQIVADPEAVFKLLFETWQKDGYDARAEGFDGARHTKADGR